MTTPRVLIWAAVSSKPQAAEDKDSLQVQENAGRAYADRIDGEIIDVLRVPGHSRDLWRWEEAEAEMPAYRSLRRHCKSEDFDILFAWDTDRLGRDAALSQQVLSLVKRAGASVYIASGGYMVGGESESASYIYAIDGVRANQEQHKRVKRHRFGMQARVRRGLHPGNWPYGYRPIRDANGETVGAEFVPHEAESVQRLTQLYLDGHGYRAIARKLEEEGYPAPGGSQWWPAAVLKVVKRDIYAGYVTWGDVRNEKPSDKFPHVWDRETYHAVIRERHRRERIKGGSDIATFLTGVVFCNRCGSAMHSHTGGHDGSYHYYRCGQSARLHRECHGNYVPLPDLLDAFDAWMDNVRSVGVDAVVQDEMSDEVARLEQERGNLEAAKAEAEAQLDRLAGAVAAGNLRGSTAKRREDALYQQIDNLNEKLQRNERRTLALPDPGQQRAYIEESLAIDTGNLTDGQEHALNRALRNLGLRILCEEGAVVAISF
jgi:site-specific DNA recombinase